MTAVVIYNAADIDSTISAAYIYDSLTDTDKRSFQGSSRIPVIKNATYHWVGVEPTKRTMEQFDINTFHHGYFIDMQRVDHDVLSRMKVIDRITIPAIAEEAFDLPPFPYNILGALMRNDPHLTGTVWMIAMLVEQFHQKDTMELILQATVYENYKAAIDTLAHNVPFNFTVATDTDDYLRHMKDMKRHLNAVYHCSSVPIDNSIQLVPVINVMNEMAPWITKLLTKVHSFVVTYEQRRGRTIYTVFSRIAGFDDVVLKRIANEPAESGLSHQM